MKPIKLITIVPCYNEEDVLKETNSRLCYLYDSMIEEGIIRSESIIVYVNDGSADSTWNIINELYEKHSYSKGINLAKNCGHQNALMAGHEICQELGDAIITIDADLQDDILAIPKMVKKFINGNDIVYGVRKKRDTDSFFKRTTAITFYKIMHLLGVKSVYNHADFRLMSSRAVKQMCKYKERNLFLRGIVPLLGYKTEIVYYDRHERFAGESKYPFSKMLNFAIDGITSFSVKPVRMVFGMGVVFLLISLIILGYVIYSILTNDIVPGWASIILSIWFVGACVLIGMGIVGEYVGKIYIEVKERPRYNIDTTLLQ